jgi:hypothetical protein
VNSDAVVEFIKSSNDNAYGPSGYLLHLSSGWTITTYVVTAGAPGVVTSDNIPGAPAEYEVLITRTSAGAFKFYMRGGTYLVWTLLANFTNNTHVTSVAFAVNFVTAVGSYISDLTFFPAGYSLLPNDVPWLKDT